MRTNWAGNHIFAAPELRTPASVAEAQTIVAAAPRVRALGTAHSFNDIADGEGLQLSLAALDRTVRIDPDRRRVTVDGGMRYGDLAPVLQANGWALANLASLPHISVAGAVMTGTHGSGSTTGNLATQVAALDILTASGDIVTLSRDTDGDTFAGAVVSLGALGVVVSLTLDIEPAYLVRQDVFTGLPFAELDSSFEAIFSAAKSVSVFTDWRGDSALSVWVKDRVTDPHAPSAPRSGFFGAAPAARKMHPLPDTDAVDCTDQLGQPGPWHERLPHFRMGFTPSNGAEIQAEFFVHRDHAPQAIAALRRHGDRLAPVLFVSEIRTVAADSLWLSPGSRGPYVGLHFTFRRDADAVCAVLPAIEADLAPFDAIPHWGKVSTMPAATIRSRLPRLADFRDLARSFDPEGKFLNPYLHRLFDGG